jgi:hypothetical protein
MRQKAEAHYLCPSYLFSAMQTQKRERLADCCVILGKLLNFSGLGFLLYKVYMILPSYLPE